MLEKFEKGKRYVYDLETVLKDEWSRKLYDSGYNKYLMDSCNRQEVVVMNETIGRIYFSDDDSYAIYPDSCIELE